MRARTINETLTFQRGLEPMKAMGTGMHPKYKTKSWKILNFIGSFGKEGVKYSDIQKFIYFELNDAPLGPDYFKKLDYSRPYPQHHGRGYWGTNLYGTGGKQGLLRNYCYKNEKGKWVLDHYPTEKNIY